MCASREYFQVVGFHFYGGEECSFPLLIKPLLDKSNLALVKAETFYSIGGSIYLKNMKILSTIFLIFASFSLFAEEKADEILGYLKIDDPKHSSYLRDVDNYWKLPDLLELEPDNAFYNCEMAKLVYVDKLDNLNKKERGFAYAKKAADIEPENAEYNYVLSCYYGFLEMHDAALASAKKAVELDGGSAVYNHRYALCLLNANKNEEALHYAKKTTELEPRKSYYHYILALANFRLGKNEEALASALVAQGKIRKKVEYFNLATKIFESTPQPSLKMISDFSIVCLNADKVDEALSFAYKAYEGDSENMMIACNLIRCLFKKQKYEEALPISRKVVALYPDERIPNFRLSETLFFLGEYEEALVYADKAIKVTPKTPIYNFNKARILVKLNRSEEALPYIQIALKLRPWEDSYREVLLECFKGASLSNNAEFNYNAARILIERCYVKEALAVSQKAVELAPDNAEYNYLFAEILFDRDFERALSHAKKATNSEPENQKFKELEIKILISMGDAKGAIERSKEIPGTPPASVEYEKDLSKALFEQQHYKEAISHFEKIKDTFDDTFYGLEYNYMFAYCLWDSGEYKKALSYARAAFDMIYMRSQLKIFSEMKYAMLLAECTFKGGEADSAEYNYDLVRVYTTIFRYKKALTYAEKALPHYADNAEFNFCVHLCHWHIGNLEKGMFYLKKAIELSPENIKYLKAAASACMEKGMYEESISFFEKVLKLQNKEDYIIYEHIAVCYSQLGKYAEALPYAQKLLKRFSDDDEIKKMVSEIEEKLKNKTENAEKTE